MATMLSYATEPTFDGVDLNFILLPKPLHEVTINSITDFDSRSKKK